MNEPFCLTHVFAFRDFVGCEEAVSFLLLLPLVENNVRRKVSKPLSYGRISCKYVYIVLQLSESSHLSMSALTFTERAHLIFFRLVVDGR